MKNKSYILLWIHWILKNESMQGPRYQIVVKFFDKLYSNCQSLNACKHTYVKKHVKNLINKFTLPSFCHKWPSNHFKFCWYNLKFSQTLYVKHIIIHFSVHKKKCKGFTNACRAFRWTIILLKIHSPAWRYQSYIA